MPQVTHITFVDGIVFLILLIFLLRGIWTGFAKQLTFIVAIVLGFAAAGRYHEKLDPIIAPLIKNPQIDFLVTCTILFVAVYLTVMLIGLGLKKVLAISLLGWFDRLLGGVFGICKAVFITSLLFMALVGFLPNAESFLQKSYSYPFIAASSRFILTQIKVHDLPFQKTATSKQKDPASLNHSKKIINNQ